MAGRKCAAGPACAGGGRDARQDHDLGAAGLVARTRGTGAGLSGRWRATEFRHLSAARSEEHTSELPSLMRISYAVFCLKKNTQIHNTHESHTHTYIANQ